MCRLKTTNFNCLTQAPNWISCEFHYHSITQEGDVCNCSAIHAPVMPNDHMQTQVWTCRHRNARVKMNIPNIQIFVRERLHSSANEYSLRNVYRLVLTRSEHDGRPFVSCSAYECPELRSCCFCSIKEDKQVVCMEALSLWGFLSCKDMRENWQS